MSGAKRAPKGQGGLKQRGNGKWYWQQSFGADPETGKRIRPTIERKTRAELVEAKNMWLAGHAEKMRTRTSKPAKAGSVAAWVSRWLPTVAVEKSANTYTKYELNVRLRIIPALGHLDLTEVTTGLVRQMLGPLTPPTREATLVTLGSAWTAAFNAKQVLDPDVVRQAKESDSNPAMRTTTGLSAAEEDEEFLQTSAQGDLNKPAVESMRADDLAATLAVLENNRLRARWLLGLIFGLRQSEVVGLLWDDLLPDGKGGGYLDVKRSWTRPQYRHGCADITACGRTPSKCPRGERLRRGKGTKSAKRNGEDPGARTIKIGPEMMRILLEWRKKQNDELDKLGLTDRRFHWMFTNSTGTQLAQRNDRERWQTVLKQAKVSRHYSLHHMRHTAASEAAASGLDRATLQIMFGWASAAMIETYAHTRDDRLSGAWEDQEGRFLPPRDYK